jgi:hypothetical protein
MSNEEAKLEHVMRMSTSRERIRDAEIPKCRDVA